MDNLPAVLVTHSDIVISGLLILTLLGVSAFFSASETALTAVSRARLYQLVMDGNKRAKLVSKLRREKESLIGTVLLGNNAVNIAASTIATTLTIKLFGAEGEGLVVVSLIMTLIVVVFTEVLPKTYAIQNAERVALHLSPVLALAVKLFYPLTISIQLFIKFLFKIFGVGVNQSNTLISATDVIRGTIELHHREGNMIKQDRDMLGSILDLNDIEVRDIMIHRKHVETLAADQPADDLMAAAVKTMHSRIPLWRDNPDNIIGVLHMKTLIKAYDTATSRLSTAEVLATAAKPWFIPGTTSLRDQLLAFRAKRQHFAFVVDEYGAWLGVVTLEDIIEEIVGDIDDEHDEKDTSIQQVHEDAFIVDGDVTVRDLNRQLDWTLSDEKASTIAGVMIAAAEAIPAIGEALEVDGVRMTVLARDASQITKLRLEKLHSEAASDEPA